MATLPREAVDAYTERLNRLSDAARSVVAAQLAQIEYEDIADLREKVIAILEPVCAASSEVAAAYAAEFYDEVREAQAGAVLGAQAVSTHSAEATARAVRAMVQIIVDGKPWERFARQVEDRADYEVKRSAGECVKANAARDPLRPKWARVPSGAETCGFCLMLASRGFAYASERSASEKAEGGHYHPNCDCRVVVSFNGSDIEGYDPDELYRQWKRGERDREMRKQIRQLLGDDASGIAKFETRDIKPHEFDAYRVLMGDGRDFTVKAVDADARRRGKSSPDLFMDGHRYELKCPDGANEKKTITRNINRAIEQMKNADPPAKSVRVVLSAMGTPLSRGNVLHHANKKMTEGEIDELILILSESEVVTMKK